MQILSFKEVDVQLKAVCEKFIAEMSASLMAPLKDLLSKCDVIFQLAEKDHLDPASILHQQPFAKAGNFHHSFCIVYKKDNSIQGSVLRGHPISKLPSCCNLVTAL